MSCCEARPTGPSGDVTNVTMENVGGGAEFYVNTTGPNPFQIRTLTSTNSTISITQNAETINIASNVSLSNEGTGADVYDVTNSTATSKLFRRLKSTDSTIAITQNATDVNLANAVALANEGGFAEFYDTATSTATTKNIRTLRSSDGSISVTQNATNIDIKVASALKTYYAEENISVGTNGTTYVVVSTLAAMTGALAGEVWTLNCSALICCLQGLTTVNQVIRWEIETSAGVWGVLETAISHQWGITLAVGDVSTPSMRTYNVTLGMNAPRVRLLTRMSAAVASGGIVENPKVSGYKRS